MGVVDLLGARGTGDQGGRGRDALHQEADHLDGVGVAPLQIVNDEQRRNVALEECRRDRVEQLVATAGIAPAANGVQLA